MQDRFSLENLCAEERISLSSNNISEDLEREGSHVKEFFNRIKLTYW